MSWWHSAEEASFDLEGNLVRQWPALRPERVTPRRETPALPRRWPAVHEPAHPPPLRRSRCPERNRRVASLDTGRDPVDVPSLGTGDLEVAVIPRMPSIRGIPALHSDRSRDPSLRWG